MGEHHAIIVTELMWPEGLEILQEKGPVLYDPGLGEQPVRLAALLEGARALVVRNRTRVTEKLLAAAPSLLVVGRLGAGLDNVDTGACRRRGVEVVYAPGANAVSVAEMTFALILTLSRRLMAAHAGVRAGRWDRVGCTGVELMGKTIGILGFGRIGRLVAERARAFGMEIIVHHPRLSPGDPDLARLEGRLTSPGELLGAADVLTLHLPLTPQTRHLIAAAELARMKPSAILVNTGRGGVVDEAALAAALAAGTIAGAALDVREEEPPPSGDPAAERLNALPNVILTPHVAGLTGESQSRTCTVVARDVVRVLQGAAPLHPVPLG